MRTERCGNQAINSSDGEFAKIVRQSMQKKKLNKDGIEWRPGFAETRNCYNKPWKHIIGCGTRERIFRVSLLGQKFTYVQ